MDALARPTELHPIREPEDVGSLRRAIRSLASALEIAPADSARVELAATELGTNILIHASSSGYVLVQEGPDADGPGMEIVAVDRGPGIADVNKALHGAQGVVLEEALAAGATRPRGLGCGLASVERLASEFDLYSMSGWGTAVLARFRFGPRPPRPGFRCGGVVVPLAGEIVSGDAWAFKYDRTGSFIVLADGLGHGPDAARAAAAAMAAFRTDEHGNDPDRYLRQAHDALRSTRGAAVSTCRIDSGVGTAFFAGVGNVDGRVYLEGRTSGLVPRNGTLGVGLHAPRIQIREGRWDRGALLILHSDGIRGHFDLQAHGTLPRRDPTIIAAVLHRDLARDRDDATLVVVKDARTPES